MRETDPVQRVGRTSGMFHAVLDPIEGLSDDDPDDDYLGLMRENLAALKKAGECS